MVIERMRLWVAMAMVVLSVGSVTVALVAGRVYADFTVSDIGLGAAAATFGVVGALIVARVPGNGLGWAFGVIGAALMLSGFQDMARPMLEAGVSPGLVAVGQAVADMGWDTGTFVILVLVPSWFPDGRALSPRWGWVVKVGAAGWALLAVLDVFAARKSIVWDYPDGWVSLPNPIGMSWIPDNEGSTFGDVVFLVVAICGIASIAALFVRYHRAGSLERLQIRWLRASFFVLAIVMLTGVFFGSAIDGAGAPAAGLYDLCLGVAVLGIPLAAAIAITRYRLYDLGRVVSRTVTYGIVIGGLGVVFVSGALWLPQRLSGSGSNFAVAASTLIVFVLFAPLRRRVLAIVDRRFNRLPYDADRVVSGLRVRLGNQVEMESVTAAFVAASDAALRPAMTAVWIRARS